MFLSVFIDMFKKKEDNILLAIQTRTPLSYEAVEKLYFITNSYDAILEINEISIRFNVDVIQLALHLYGNKNDKSKAL